MSVKSSHVSKKLLYHLEMKKSSQSKIHKHLRVYSALHQAITAGRWGVGEKLPSEAELVRQFGVSRITPAPEHLSDGSRNPRHSHSDC